MTDSLPSQSGWLIVISTLLINCAYRDDLATIITLENGKSLTEAKVEITGSLQQVEWFAAEAHRNYGDFIPSPIANIRNVVIKQGVGVAGLVRDTFLTCRVLGQSSGRLMQPGASFACRSYLGSELNKIKTDLFRQSSTGSSILSKLNIVVISSFPALMLIRKAAAALAAGATIVCKTPSETPFSSLAFAELCHRAGIPDGVVNVISTSRSSPVGMELCTNPLVSMILPKRHTYSITPASYDDADVLTVFNELGLLQVRKISFTGSTGVGRKLAEQSASTLKKCSFELGGNAPL